MKIAVIGIGLCGLSSAYFLQKAYPDASITLMDSDEGGKGASHIAAGMIHTLAGHEGKKAPDGDLGLKQTLSLVRFIEKEIGKKLFIPGLLRIPRDERFRDSLYASSPEKWIGFDQVLKKSGGSVEAEGLWIQEGGSIFVEEYLQGLFVYLKGQGCAFKKKKITHVDELQDFDVSVLALGAQLTSVEGIALFSMTYKLGQIAHLRVEPPPFPIIGRAYSCPTSDFKGVVVGGTYEDATQSPDKAAMDKLIEYASLAYKPLQNAQVIKRPFAVRAYGPSKRPFIKEVAKNVWAIGGIGSRGLLYHVLLAKKLIKMIENKKA